MAGISKVLERVKYYSTVGYKTGIFYQKKINADTEDKTIEGLRLIKELKYELKVSKMKEREKEHDQAPSRGAEKLYFRSNVVQSRARDYQQQNAPALSYIRGKGKEVKVNPIISESPAD